MPKIIALAWMLILATPVWAEEYIEGTEDVPLMEGLANLPGASLIFDKPDGRIVESYVGGAVSEADVRAFYRQTLPALGWQALGSDAVLRFVREDEILTIDPLGADPLTIRFSLRPQ